MAAMGKERVYNASSQILDFGTWVPDREIINANELGSIFENIALNLDDIVKKTGVSSRRKSSPDETLLDMAESAVTDLFGKENMQNTSLGMIDTIIYASVSRMHLEPSTAIMLQRRLGIESAFSFDLSNACISFVDAIIVADSLISSGKSEHVLVVSAEKGAQVSHVSAEALGASDSDSRYIAALTLGDGAVAAMVTAMDHSQRGMVSLKAFTRASRSQYADCCILQSLEEPMFTDSRTMFEGVLLHFPEMFRTLVDEIGWDINDIDALVPHQASLKIIENGMKAIGFPLEKTAISLGEFGNMASVSVPFTLSRLLDSSVLAPGAKIAIVASGSGLSFSMLAVEVL